MRRYNDYELIYLIQSENVEVAFTIMIAKYRLMIYKYLHLFNVNKEEFDDFYQEAIILMYQAIDKFDERKGKTFTRFYELILKRRIMRLIRSLPKYELYEDFSMYADKSNNYEEIETDNLTLFESRVYERYFLQNQKIEFIAKMEEKSAKQIYNAIYRIKDKYKNNML